MTNSGEEPRAVAQRLLYGGTNRATRDGKENTR